MADAQQQEKPAEPVRIELKKNDTVKVIAGRDKGKTGRVLEVDRETGKVLVEHVMMIKRHTRPNPAQADQGRHRRAGEPDPRFERDDVCPGCDKADAHRRITWSSSRRQDAPDARLPQERARRSTGSKARIHGSKFERALHEEGGSGADQGVRLQERHGGAEDREDLDQHRPGRGHAERQADGRRGERAERRSPARSRSSPRRSKSIAAFKLREGMPIGCMVTLRGDRMYEFFDRLVNVALPRVRDFRGVSTKSLRRPRQLHAGHQGSVDLPGDRLQQGGQDQGHEHHITTTARTDAEGLALLEAMGMPFRQYGQ